MNLATRLFFTTLISLVSVILFCVFLLTTTSGLKLSYYLSKPLLPGNITIKELDGSLIGPLHLTKLTYQNEDLKVDIETATLNWHFASILQNKLIIDQLALSNVTTTTTIAPWLQLPIESINLQGEIDKLFFQPIATIDAITIKLLDGVLQGKLKFNIAGSWDSQITANSINLALLFDGLPHNTHFQLSSQGDLSTQLPIIDILLSDLTGHTEENKIEGDIHFSLNEKNHYALDSQIQFAETVFSARGKLTDKWALEWSLESPNLTLLDHDLSGKLAFIGKISGAKEAPLVNSTFSLHNFYWENNHIDLLHQTLTYHGREHILDLSLQIRHLQIPGFALKELELNGEGFIDNAQESIHFKLSGKTELPLLNLNFPNFELTSSVSAEGLSYKFNIDEETGQLSLIGLTTYENEEFQSNLTITGNNFPLSDTPNYLIYVSPDLNLKINSERIDIKGNVNIPKAYIENELTEELITESADIVYEETDADTHEKKTGLAIYSDLDITLDDNIKINLWGIQGKVSGNLSLHEEPNTPTTAVGTLSITQGSYAIYGRKLTLRQGILTFAGGAIDNPGLNIQAVREITLLGQSNPLEGGPRLDKQIVGIRVTGTLNNPDIQLFAEPANLSQADILSYIVLGRPINSIAQAEGEQIFNAASALNLGLNGMTAITAQLQDTLGLDEISIQNNSYYHKQSDSLRENTTLLLGKALSPRLQLNYNVGLLRPDNTVTLRYLLNKNISLQTEAGQQNQGIDLFYTFERD